MFFSQYLVKILGQINVFGPYIIYTKIGPDSDIPLLDTRNIENLHL